MLLLAFHHPPPKPDSVVVESGFFLSLSIKIGNCGRLVQSQDRQALMALVLYGECPVVLNRSPGDL